jgi:hypothetical protein
VFLVITTAVLLMLPMALELMLPLMLLSQPIANSPLNLDSGSDWARAGALAPNNTATIIPTTNGLPFI